MADVKKLAQEVAQKRTEMKTIFDGAKIEGSDDLNLTKGQIKELNDRETELKSLTEQYQEAKRLAELGADNERGLAELKAPVGSPLFSGRHPKDGPEEPGTKQIRSMGELLVSSKAYQEQGQRNGLKTEIEGVNLKTVMQTGAGAAGGYPPEVLRSGRVVYTPQAKPTLIDLIPTGETTQNAYKYMQETVYVNAAAEVAEGGQYPEAQLKFAEVLGPIVKIAVFIPLTDEQLADQANLRDIVDARLGLMLKQRLNGQIVSGDGTGANLTGVLNVPGILNYTKGVGAAENIPDAVYKAIVQVNTVGFADASGVWFNPNDWTGVRLLKNTQGSYLYGDPSQSGPDTIFGLPVSQHVRVTAGKAIVGDWQAFTQLIYRAGVEFAISDSHADFFAKGQLALRAQMRVCFAVYRPQAICTASGLNA